MHIQNFPGPQRRLSQAFFFTPAKKLKAKKTQAPRKLKSFLATKPKVPGDILEICPLKLQFKLNFLSILTKYGTEFPPNIKQLELLPNFGKKSQKIPLIYEKLKQILKKTQGLWLKT